MTEAGADNGTQGEWLRGRRSTLRRTQKWLAEAADVSERTVIRAERNDPVSDENLLAICSVLGLDPQDAPPSRAAVDDPCGAVPESGGRPVPEGTVGSSGGMSPGFAFLFVLPLLFGAFLGVGHGKDTASWPLDVQAKNELVDMSTSVSLARSINRIAYVTDGDPAFSDSDRSAFAALEKGVVMRLACADGSGCRVSSVNSRNLVARNGDATTVVVHPASSLLLRATARQLSRDPRVQMAFAVGDVGASHGRGVLWFDPRGLSDDQLPSIPDGGSFSVMVSRR